MIEALQVAVVGGSETNELLIQELQLLMLKQGFDDLIITNDALDVVLVANIEDKSSVTTIAVQELEKVIGDQLGLISEQYYDYNMGSNLIHSVMFAKEALELEKRMAESKSKLEEEYSNPVKYTDFVTGTAKQRRRLRKKGKYNPDPWGHTKSKSFNKNRGR